jgi:aminomethyltransferase
VRFNDADWLVARTGYTGEDGFEITLPAAEAALVWYQLRGAGIKPCGLGARDTLRLEAGMNLYGQDMDENISPYEAGLKWTVDIKDAGRDFVGKAAIEGPEARPAPTSSRACCCSTAACCAPTRKSSPRRARARPPAAASRRPSNQSIALARLPHGVAIGSEVEVEIRDKRLKARVVKPVFVRNGNPLI